MLGWTNLNNLVCKRLFVTFSKLLLFSQYAYKITNKKFWVLRKCCIRNQRYKPLNDFFCDFIWSKFDCSLELIVLTNESSLSRYKYVRISSKYLYIIFFRERIFRSAKSDFFSLNVLYKRIPRLLQRSLKAPMIMFDHLFLKASAVSVAYFVFSGSTLRYLERPSTATRR